MSPSCIAHRLSAQPYIGFYSVQTSVRINQILAVLERSEKVPDASCWIRRIISANLGVALSVVPEKVALCCVGTLVISRSFGFVARYSRRSFLEAGPYIYISEPMHSFVSIHCKFHVRTAWLTRLDRFSPCRLCQLPQPRASVATIIHYKL